MRKKHFGRIAVIASVAAIALTAGCSSGESGAGSSSDAASGGKVTLKFWSWAPNSQKIVDTWNKAHPDIQVKYTDAGGGRDSSAKLLTASRAGNAPDLAAVEYQTLPSLVVADVPADITDDVKDVKSAYTKGTLQQVTFDGHVFGLPQDTGPMALVYRTDLFAKYGVKVPTTWQEFATAAATIHAKDPKAYIASIPPDQMNFFAGVAAQNGASWWSYKNDKWTVGIGDDATLQMADFFQDLADKGLVSTDPILTPEWNAQVNSGKILSWPSAMWAPGVLEGIAADTIGKWEMTNLPAWKAGDDTVAYQGGSSVIVTKNSKHPKEALEFAKWLNASDEGSKLILTVQNAYPAATSGQTAAQSADPPALMPQQKDFYTVAKKISSSTIPVTWGPDVNVAQTALTDALSKAVTNKTPWRDAFTATQKAVIADMKKAGFTVTNG